MSCILSIWIPGQAHNTWEFCSHKMQFLFFPNSDAFSPLKYGGRGSIMFSAKYKFRKSHGCLGNVHYEGKMIGLKNNICDPCTVEPWDGESSLGGSLKTFLFWESTRTCSRLCTSSLQHGLFTPSYIIGYKLVGFIPQSEFSALEYVDFRCPAWSLLDDFTITASVMLLRLIGSSMIYIYNEWA